MALRRRVARWASRPIELGAGSVLRPLVLGPETVPVITDLERARRAPELAVLSAMAHGRGNVETALRIARAAGEACKEAPEGVLYWDLIESSLGAVARRALEAEMASTEGYKFRSKFALDNQAKGQAQGLTEGKAQGLTEGKAEAILAVLEARSLEVADEQRERVLACRDLEELDRWLRRAAVVDAPAALFE